MNSNQNKSFAHEIRRVNANVYVVSWSLMVPDINQWLSGASGPRRFKRQTDAAGARRFAARWGCKMPEESNARK